MWVRADDELVAEVWPGSTDFTMETLSLLLEAAFEQCAAFAPALAPGMPPPERWKLAQIYQARAISQAGRVDNSGSTGMDDLTVTLFPMDWHVKNLLRPQAGRPRVG